MNEVEFNSAEIIEIIHQSLWITIALDLMLITIALYRWFSVEKRINYRAVGVLSVVILPIVASITLIVLSAKRKRSGSQD